MVNFGPLAAEIGSLVWGTPANFNGFRVLAALLHGKFTSGRQPNCGVEQRAPAVFGRTAITLGSGSHSIVAFLFKFVTNESQRLVLCVENMMPGSERDK